MGPKFKTSGGPRRFYSAAPVSMVKLTVRPADAERTHAYIMREIKVLETNGAIREADALWTLAAAVKEAIRAVAR